MFQHLVRIGVIALLMTVGVAQAASNPADSPERAVTPKGDLYALVVGIAKYREPKIRELGFAANDARTFAEMLRKQSDIFRTQRILLLTDEQATQRAIHKFLTRELRRSGKDDTIVIFFSGHGVYDPDRTTDFYFCPYDIELGYFAATGVKMSGLEFLEGLESRRVLVIADACHAGGFSGYTGRSKDLPPNLSVFMRDFQNSAGRVILTSAAPNEKSWELEEIEGQPKLKHGVFTHFLLQGLRGKADTDRNGEVTVHEAYQYAYDMTRAATGGRQHPQFEGRHSGGFPLAFSGTVIPPWKLKRSLLHAIGSGNLARVKELRAELPDVVTARDDRNRTSLIIAAETGRGAMVDLLLGQRPDLEAKSDTGDTALIVAARGGHADIVKTLLGKGADVDAKNKAEESALTVASRAGHTKVVNVLLDHGANVRAINKHGSGALALASYKGHQEIVRLLLEKGADPTAEDFFKRTPLNLASRYGHSEVVRMLLDRIPKPRTATQNERLIRGVLRGDPAVVAAALNRGADVNLRTPSGDTPLTLASGLGHARIVRLLLRRKADVNSRITFESTALSWAAYNGRTETAEILLDHGAEVDARDAGGSTPLTFAAQNGRRDIVALLLERGADVNNRTNDGSAPLTLLLNPKEGDKSGLGPERILDLAQTLLDAGADVNSATGSGVTPLALAAENGYADVAALLLERDAQVNSRAEDGAVPLMGASARGHAAVIRMLLDAGASVDQRNRKGETALFLAAKNGHTKPVELLIASGADPAAATREGLTPAMVARDGGHTDAAALLGSVASAK